MSKKLILSFTIIVILLNALLPQFAFADTVSGTGALKMESLEGQNTRKEMKTQSFQDIFNTPLSVMFDGATGYISQVGTMVFGEAGNFASAIVKTILKIVILIPYSLQLLMTLVTKADGEEVVKGGVFSEIFDPSKYNWFTIEKAVFGKVPIYDINFFDLTTEGSEINTKMKESVVSWYNVTLRLAQILSILVLIYIGIRMAMASKPEDKINYKTLFKHWIVSFALLFLLHYGMVIILTLADWFITLIPSNILDKNLEKDIVSETISLMDIYDSKVSIWSVIIFVITYFIIVGYQVYFFLKYFMRLFTMGFLVIVAPLITVTYAIDKADDGKAQAYTTWMKLFIKNTFMQTVHAVMYALFAFSASAIALKAPMIAVIFFMGLTKGEQIFNKLFKLS